MPVPALLASRSSAAGGLQPARADGDRAKVAATGIFHLKGMASGFGDWDELVVCEVEKPALPLVNS